MANVKFFTEDDVEDGKATVVPATYTITGLTQEEYDTLLDSITDSVPIYTGAKRLIAARLMITLIDNKVIQ